MRPRMILCCALLLLVPLVLGPVDAQGPCGPVYTVVEGDTLFSIARRCGLTVGQILAANPGIPDPNRILVGQRLFLPAGGITPPPGAPDLYVVRDGDTLLSIARRFGTTVQALLAANPAIGDPNRIQVGQVLLIPRAGFRTPTPPAGVPSVSLAPSSGPPGTLVQVLGAGFSPGVPVSILLGPDLGRLTVVATATADVQGRVSATVVIPASAQAGESWAVFVSAAAPVPVTALAYFSVTGTPPPATPMPTPTPEISAQVQLYAIALGAGDLGCGDAVLPAATLDVAPIRAPLAAALEELLALGPTVPGRPDLYNALGQSSLQVEAVDLVGDTAIVRLVGEYRIGGVCDEPRVRAQLESTVLQFAAVRQSVMFVNGVLLEELLDGQG